MDARPEYPKTTEQRQTEALERIATALELIVIGNGWASKAAVFPHTEYLTRGVSR